MSILTFLLNPTAEDKMFRLPEPHWPARVLLETMANTFEERRIDGVSIPVTAHSAVLLHSEQDLNTR